MTVAALTRWEPPTAGRPRHRDSPRVRAWARERGVDLAAVTPTGAHGRATRADVDRAGERPEPGRTLLTAVAEVDVTPLVGAAGDRSPLLAAVAEAAVRALRGHPALRAADRGTSDGVHLAVQVEADGVAATLDHAEELTVAGLARRIAEGRAGSAATFTLIDTGARGTWVDPLLVAPPQVAALACGAVVRRPAALLADGEERIAVRSMVTLSLTYDAARVDGADAAGFLTAVRARLLDGAPTTTGRPS